MSDTLLQAIAREEGFNVKGSRAERNNNPGNIEWGRFSKAHGATGGDPRFAVFPNPAAGFFCMRALFLGAYRGMSILETITRWAPPTENDTALYVRNVVQWTGLPFGTIIDEHLGSPLAA